MYNIMYIIRKSVDSYKKDNDLGIDSDMVTILVCHKYIINTFYLHSYAWFDTKMHVNDAQ